MIAKYGEVRDCDVMSYVMFPKVLEEFLEFKQKFGPVECLDTRVFFVGPILAEPIEIEIEKGWKEIIFLNFPELDFEFNFEGKTLKVKVLAISEIRQGAQREVFFELNGQLRSIMIQDKSASKNVKSHPKAVKSSKGSIGAPMPGTVIEVKVKVGDKVEKGANLLVLSAMKMETVVKSPVSGTVMKVEVAKGQKLEGDDLLVEIDVQ